MEQAISAYRTATATDEFRQLERMRADARNREASALGNARRRAIRETDEKWQGVVADKDAALASKEAALASKEAALADKDAALASKEAALASKDAEIELLRAQLTNQNK